MNRYDIYTANQHQSATLLNGNVLSRKIYTRKNYGPTNTRKRRQILFNSLCNDFLCMDQDYVHMHVVRKKLAHKAASTHHQRTVTSLTHQRAPHE